MKDQSRKIDPPFTAEHAQRMQRELAVVPACRECGKVPAQYYRIGDEVQCLRCEAE